MRAFPLFFFCWVLVAVFEGWFLRQSFSLVFWDWVQRKTRKHESQSKPGQVKVGADIRPRDSGSMVLSMTHVFCMVKAQDSSRQFCLDFG